MAKSKKNSWLLGLVDRLEGDKVVWIITLMLLLTSVVCIFSVSSRLISHGQTRADIAFDQFKYVLLSLGCILFCFSIKNINIIRIGSSLGWILSVVLLIILKTKGVTTNNAVRYLEIGGIQVHIFEIVKVAMVMYMAWGVDALKSGKVYILNAVSTLPHMEWVKDKFWRKVLVLYIPFLVIVLLIVGGSNSTAIIMAGIMAATIILGNTTFKGMFKDLGAMLAMIVIALVVVFTGYGLTSRSSKPMFGRIVTGMSRMHSPDYGKAYSLAEKEIAEAKTRAERQAALQRRQEALDLLRQPYSARLAISQGGVLGKGPGQSTQRYVVPDMAEDYMFSFILEEYGLAGALWVFILYVSLLARASIIIRNCGKHIFAKTAVAGLTLLICGQAFLHIAVSLGIGPMTGQTLPIISHGTSALICFSIAFGVLLSISRIAQKSIEKQEKMAAPILTINTDNNEYEPVQTPESDS